MRTDVRHALGGRSSYRFGVCREVFRLSAVFSVSAGLRSFAAGCRCTVARHLRRDTLRHANAKAQVGAAIDGTARQTRKACGASR
jgi:hypothetical protein